MFKWALRGPFFTSENQGFQNPESQKQTVTVTGKKRSPLGAIYPPPPPSCMEVGQYMGVYPRDFFVFLFVTRYPLPSLSFSHKSKDLPSSGSYCSPSLYSLPVT